MNSKARRVLAHTTGRVPDRTTITPDEEVRNGRRPDTIGAARRVCAGGRLPRLPVPCNAFGISWSTGKVATGCLRIFFATPGQLIADKHARTTHVMV